jgi:small subunit ribosomal protein S15
MEKFPRNIIEKVRLKEMIDKRKKFLRYLRKWDYKRFEWLIEKLNIIFKPYPEKFHWITRKESMRKLTDIHCDNLKQERLDAYKKELESQQLEFLADKIKNLEFIRSEQKECRVPITVANEEIQKVKKEYELLKKKREEEEELNKKLRTKEDYELNL